MVNRSHDNLNWTHYLNKNRNMKKLLTLAAFIKGILFGQLNSNDKFITVVGIADVHQV